MTIIIIVIMKSHLLCTKIFWNAINQYFTPIKTKKLLLHYTKTIEFCFY